jgi:hypothetical protein
MWFRLSQEERSVDIFLPEDQMISCPIAAENDYPSELDDVRLAMIGGGIGDVVPA